MEYTDLSRTRGNYTFYISVTTQSNGQFCFSENFLVKLLVSTLKIQQNIFEENPFRLHWDQALAYRFIHNSIVLPTQRHCQSFLVQQLPHWNDYGSFLIAKKNFLREWGEIHVLVKGCIQCLCGLTLDCVETFWYH